MYVSFTPALSNIFQTPCSQTVGEREHYRVYQTYNHAPVLLHCAGYSIWTKYSFKMPVLAGALTCLVSNVLYILSYETRSLWLLLLSRFVLGFGACCGFYLPSAYPSSLRCRCSGTSDKPKAFG